MRSSEAESVLMTMFHPNSPRELVFVSFLPLIQMVMEILACSRQYNDTDDRSDLAG